MGQVLEQLIKLLNLERLGTHLFRGHSEQLGLSQVFGGQVVGQALSAAKNTIDAERQVHSFHSYFLHPGDCSKPIDYEVEVLRDGRSLGARRIKAVQDGQPIFYMTASFQGQEQGSSHQSAMPDCPGPEQLLNEQQLIKTMSGDLPAVLVNAFSQPRPLEIRPVTLYNPVKGHISAPVRQVWIRANGQLPDRPWLHQALLGYASDLNFLRVSLQPHGKGFLEPDIQVATVDHAMWFHRPVDLSQWLLYDIVSPSASGSRGFVRGEFYSQQGEWIASAVQEGIIRLQKQA